VSQVLFQSLCLPVWDVLRDMSIGLLSVKYTNDACRWLCCYRATQQPKLARVRVLRTMRDVTINDILVVDDDQAIVEFVIGALREAGYLCCAAFDGDSALLAIETARPALVLLDLHLPDLSGLDVVAQLYRHGLAHVPVVLMTADVRAAAQLPIATFPEYLLKPFEIDVLLACVARYVRLQRGRTRSQGAHPATHPGTTDR